MGGTNSRPNHSRKLDRITKSSDHFDPLSDLPVSFTYLALNPPFPVSDILPDSAFSLRTTRYIAIHMICIRRSEGGNVKRTAPSAVAEWPACSMQPHVTPLFGVQLFYGRPYQVIVKEHYGNDKRSIFVTAFGKSRMYHFQAVEKKNKQAVVVQLISACDSL